MHPLSRALFVSVLVVLATSCGGGEADVPPLDLGGGLAMTADGAILGATDRSATPPGTDASP